MVPLGGVSNTVYGKIKVLPGGKSSQHALCVCVCVSVLCVSMLCVSVLFVSLCLHPCCV